MGVAWPTVPVLCALTTRRKVRTVIERPPNKMATCRLKNLWRLRHNTACLYRARNLVERFFNKIKQCRRVATRYDKLAANYLAFIQLASIRLWLRVNESTP
jgi:transposase